MAFTKNIHTFAVKSFDLYQSDTYTDYARFSSDAVAVLTVASGGTSGPYPFLDRLALTFFIYFQGSMIMATGVVKWFNSEKGYGFIMPDGGGKDLFAHYSEIKAEGYKTLQENQKVSFEIGQGAKGPSATNIQMVD